MASTLTKTIQDITDSMTKARKPRQPAAAKSAAVKTRTGGKQLIGSDLKSAARSTPAAPAAKPKTRRVNGETISNTGVVIRSKTRASGVQLDVSKALKAVEGATVVKKPRASKSTTATKAVPKETITKPTSDTALAADSYTDVVAKMLATAAVKHQFALISGLDGVKFGEWLNTIKALPAVKRADIDTFDSNCRCWVKHADDAREQGIVGTAQQFARTITALYQWRATSKNFFDNVMALSAHVYNHETWLLRGSLVEEITDISNTALLEGVAITAALGMIAKGAVGFTYANAVAYGHFIGTFAEWRTWVRESNQKLQDEGETPLTSMMSRQYDPENPEATVNMERLDVGTQQPLGPTGSTTLYGDGPVPNFRETGETIHVSELLAAKGMPSLTAHGEVKFMGMPSLITVDGTQFAVTPTIISEESFSTKELIREAVRHSESQYTLALRNGAQATYGEWLTNFVSMPGVADTKLGPFELNDPLWRDHYNASGNAGFRGTYHEYVRVMTAIYQWRIYGKVFFDEVMSRSNNTCTFEEWVAGTRTAEGVLTYFLQQSMDSHYAHVVAFGQFIGTFKQWFQSLRGITTHGIHHTEVQHNSEQSETPAETPASFFTDEWLLTNALQTVPGIDAVKPGNIPADLQAVLSDTRNRIVEDLPRVLAGDVLEQLQNYICRHMEQVRDNPAKQG